MKKTEYVKIPRKMLEDKKISPRAKIVMVMLIARGSQMCTTYQDLVLETEFSISTVYRSLTELREQGYCYIDGQKNIMISDWEASCYT